MQTLAVTYDGKYVIGVFSGFQRQESGIAFIDAETDELIGIWPSNGGTTIALSFPLNWNT
jgi:hypothetical protein